MTLLELAVVLVIVALLAGIVAAAARWSPRARRPDLASRIDSMRSEALRLGRAQHGYFRDSTRSGELLVLPTGAIVADSTLRVEPLTGGLRP